MSWGSSVNKAEAVAEMKAGGIVVDKEGVRLYYDRHLKEYVNGSGVTVNLNDLDLDGYKIFNPTSADMADAGLH